MVGKVVNQMLEYGLEGLIAGQCRCCREESPPGFGIGIDKHYKVCQYCYELLRRMKKYPKILSVDHRNTRGVFEGEVFISEKFDGSCGRFQTRPNGFIIGSKGRVFDRRPFRRNLPAQDKVWWRFWDWMEEKNLENFPDDWVIFGEVCGQGNTHKISYNFPLTFIVFDVWSNELEHFLNPEVWMPVMDANDFPYSAHYSVSTTQEEMEALVNEKDVDRDRFEGYVIKNFNCICSRSPTGRMFAKIYHPDAKKKDSKIFGKARDQEQHKLEFKLMQQWVDMQRVVHVLHAGWDEGQPRLGMEAMVWLPKQIWLDIKEEELLNYLATQLDKNLIHLNIRFMRKRLGGIVAQLLQEHLTEMAKQ